jgi:hypothetical protein
MNRRAITLVLGALLALLLAACTESLNGSAGDGYVLLPIDSSGAVYGGSLTVSYDDLEFVDIVDSDGVISAVNATDGNLDIALASPTAQSGRLATLVFQGNGSVSASDFDAISSDLTLTSVSVASDLITSPEMPASISTQQVNAVLIPATATLQASFASFPLGDYDQSGAVALIDVVRILQVLTGQTNTGAISDYQYFISDFTANGRIDLLDAVAALQKVVGAPANLVTQTSGSLSVGTTVTLVLFNSGSDSFSTTPTINAPAGVTVTGPSPSVAGQSFAYSVQIGASATGSVVVNAGGANQASLPISGSGGGGGNGGTGDPLLDIVFYTTDTSTAINPSPVTGQMTVRANFDLGSASAQRIELLLNGVVAQSQPVLGTQSQADLSVDTSAFDCDSLTPEYPNGDYDIGVRLVLSDNSFVNARNAASFAGVTFGNADRVTLEVLSGNNVQASGVTWYGGGDVEFRVCPIIYDTNGSAVEQVVVNPERDNGGDTLNIGAGAGLPRTISRGTAPNFFTFTAFQAPNQNYEDSRAPVRRTTLFNVDALDANSLNIASLVSDPYYLDFKGPSVTGQVRYRRFNFGTNTRAPAFQTTPVPLSATNLQDSNRYIGPNTPIAAPIEIFDEGVGLPAGYQPGIDVIPGNATNVLATLAVSDSTTGQDLANELNVFTTTNVVTPTTGYRIQLTDGTEDRLGNTMTGTEIEESRSDILGFDFDAPAIANVGPAPATNPNTNGVFSNSFLPVLAINEDLAPATASYTAPAPATPPIIEGAAGAAGTYLAYDDTAAETQAFVFNSIFRAQVTDINSGLNDGDPSNDVDAYTARLTGVGTDFDVVAAAAAPVPGTPPTLLGPEDGNINDTVATIQEIIDGPFDKTIAVRQNGVVLPLVDAADAGPDGDPLAGADADGNFDNAGFAIERSGGTEAAANTYNFIQSGANIGDAQVNLNVVFYDAVGNASNANNPAADTAFNFEIDRTPPNVAFQSYTNPVSLGASPTVTSSGFVRVSDANIDLNNSYVIVTTSSAVGTPVGTDTPDLTVRVNGQLLTFEAGQVYGALTFAQAGLTNSSGFQPLELEFNTPENYTLIIRSTDLARQLDEADVTTDDDTLPQPAAAIAPEFLGFGNSANDSTTIQVTP